MAGGGRRAPELEDDELKKRMIDMERPIELGQAEQARLPAAAPPSAPLPPLLPYDARLRQRHPGPAAGRVGAPAKDTTDACAHCGHARAHGCRRARRRGGRGGRDSGHRGQRVQGAGMRRQGQRAQGAGMRRHACARPPLLCARRAWVRMEGVEAGGL